MSGRRKAGRGGCRGCLGRLGVAALLLGVLAAGGLYVLLGRPYQGYTGEVILEIPRGTGTVAIARRLADAGVVQNQWFFLTARTLRGQATLQAGEYRFSQPESPWAVVGKLARGDVFYYEVAIPEGANLFDIAALVGQGRVIPEKAFLAAARDPALVRALDPQAPSLEGYLFPATYRYTRQTTARQLAGEMVARFRRAWAELKAPAGTDVHRIVTLASLVEKETAQPSERPLIASVYANRLKAGMSMDCDPTVIYAALLEGRYRGTIYRSDLDNPHPYNTYRHPGLPPGPIANPGLESLQAALRPADAGFLFFVAKPDGSGAHQFSTSLGEHTKAVAQYRKGVAGR